jgi:hypothetical protein
MASGGTSATAAIRRISAASDVSVMSRRHSSSTSWRSSPSGSPAGSTNTPQTSRSASYPVVPSTGQDAGSDSPTARIFSTTSQADGAAARSHRMYPPGSASPSGWSTRRPVTSPSATQRSTSSCVAWATAGSSTRTPARVVMSKNRR